MVAAAMSCQRDGHTGAASAQAPDHVQRVASAPAPAAVSDDARAQAESIFGERCAVCHGESGEGNGPGAGNLNPKPKNFHNQKWQKSISDDRIAKAIIYGGQAVGLSASMAPNPDLESKPDIVAALVERIRKLGK
jgi:cytochrome c553